MVNNDYNRSTSGGTGLNTTSGQIAQIDSLSELTGVSRAPDGSEYASTRLSAANSNRLLGHLGSSGNSLSPNGGLMVV